MIIALYDFTPLTTASKQKYDFLSSSPGLKNFRPLHKATADPENVKQNVNPKHFGPLEGFS